MMREDNQMIVLTHLSQLLSGFLLPLILWLLQRDKIVGMDAHGKLILNFQISMFIYSLCCLPLMIVFGLGVVLLLIIAALSFILPIINAIKASNGELVNYPFTIHILK